MNEAFEKLANAIKSADAIFLETTRMSFEGGAAPIWMTIFIADAPVQHLSRCIGWRSPDTWFTATTDEF